jgi:hypothetical protein
MEDDTPTPSTTAPMEAAIQDRQQQQQQRQTQDSEDRCAITLTPFNELRAEDILFLPCGHRFETTSIMHHLQVRDTRCPLCRTPVPTDFMLQRGCEPTSDGDDDEDEYADEDEDEDEEEGDGSETLGEESSDGSFPDMLAVSTRSEPVATRLRSRLAPNASAHQHRGAAREEDRHGDGDEDEDEDEDEEGEDVDQRQEDDDDDDAEEEEDTRGSLREFIVDTDGTDALLTDEDFCADEDVPEEEEEEEEESSSDAIRTAEGEVQRYFLMEANPTEAAATTAAATAERVPTPFDPHALGDDVGEDEVMDYENNENDEGEDEDDDIESFGPEVEEELHRAALAAVRVSAERDSKRVKTSNRGYLQRPLPPPFRTK